MSEDTPFDREFAHRAHDASNKFFHQVNGAAIEASNFALKTLILLNGGAMLSLLTFVGSNAEQRKPISAILSWFAYGLIFAAVSICLAYATHYCTAGSEASKEKTYEPMCVIKSTTTSEI